MCKILVFVQFLFLRTRLIKELGILKDAKIFVDTNNDTEAAQLRQLAENLGAKVLMCTNSQIKGHKIVWKYSYTHYFFQRKTTNASQGDCI